MDHPRIEARGWRTDNGDWRTEDGEHIHGRACYLTVSLQLGDPGLLPLPEPGGLHLLPAGEGVTLREQGGGDRDIQREGGE